MAAEPTTRFAHLLQPIRDLSKVWKIEIADELEKYIEEVAELLVTSPEDGVTKINFAEAALLIQGSTAVYSRKVELLYQLVYQALDLLALDKAKEGVQGKKAKAAQSGLWAPIPETEELLTVDHLIKEGRNILLDSSSSPEQRQAMQCRVPLFLMPRDQNDRRKKEFRISTCTVHRSGVYLLQESDAKLLDELLVADGANQGSCPDGPLVPAPPREVQDLDDRLQELLRELPEEAPKPAEDAKSPGPEEEAEGQVVKQAQTPAQKDALKTPMQKSTDMAEAGTCAKKVLMAGPDPWACLDEHATAGQDLPLEVGRTCKRLNSKKLLVDTDGLPILDACDNTLSDEALWSSDAVDGAATMFATGHPVESLFMAVAGHLKLGRKSEVHNAGFPAAWLEFEDLFQAASAKRRQQKPAAKGNAAAPRTPQAATAGESDGENSEDEGRVKAVNATPTKVATSKLAELATLGPPPEASEEQLRQEEQRREVAMLESMIQDAQQKYESTIRQHLQSMSQDATDTDSKKFPQLYANVRRWQDQLQPVLKEFESRPDFDIHEYSTKFLTKLAGLGEGDEGKLIPFARLVHGQPRWEVCRRFLTCLLLTNQGNTDIVYQTEDERLNKFRIKLLKAQKEWISLEEEEANDAGQQAAQGRKKPGKTEEDAAQGNRRRTKKARTT